MGRAPCCEKVGLKKGRWTAEEDEILTNYIRANGEGSWRSLPNNAGLLRCGKSCRLRWINYLRDDLKRGNISAEEEQTIIKQHASLGNRWSLIASHLPGRTDNEIKNYWNSHLSKKIYSFRTPASTDSVPVIIDTPKRKGGRTSRWAMKKNKSTTQKITGSAKKKEQQNVEAVPLPPIPALENESLSIVSVSALEDFLGLDLDTEDKVERAEGAEPRSYYGGGRDGRTNKNAEGEEGIDDGGVLCFNEMDTCLQLEVEAGGVLTLSEEREINVGDECVSGMTCPNKMATSEDLESVNHSWNGESTGERYSCSSMSSGFDNNWDWESVVQLNHDRCKSWEDKQNLLSWLWKDDDWESDCQIAGEIDPEKQNAMVAWFLS